MLHRDGLASKRDWQTSGFYRQPTVLAITRNADFWYQKPPGGGPGRGLRPAAGE
jgi:hypothetical protein